MAPKKRKSRRTVTLELSPEDYQYCMSRADETGNNIEGYLTNALTGQRQVHEAFRDHIQPVRTIQPEDIGAFLVSLLKQHAEEQPMRLPIVAVMNQLKQFQGRIPTVKERYAASLMIAEHWLAQEKNQDDKE